MSTHHGFLWIKSKPGAGKSTLMKYLLESIMEHEALSTDGAARRSSREIVMSFFFNARGDVLEKPLEGMYRHLIHQLLTECPRLQALFQASDIMVLQRLNWPRKSLQALLRQCLLSIGRDSLVCFVDALDECLAEDVRELIDYFEDLGVLTLAKKIDFRVCFSSRHYPHITLKYCLHLDLDILEEHQQDIMKYIEGNLCLNESIKVDGIKASILARAKGVFLWVVLVIKLLNEECGTDNNQIQDRLEKIPDGLSDLFRDVFRTDNHNVGSTVLLFQWVMFAVRPLRREELYFALHTAEPMNGAGRTPIIVKPRAEVINRFIIDCSKGLVEVTAGKNHDVVQFIHESVRDYLIADGFQVLAPDLTIDLQCHSHDILRRTCTSVITPDALLQLRQLITEVREANPDDKFKPFDMNFCPLLEYAASYVVWHAESAYEDVYSRTEFISSSQVETWDSIGQLLSVAPIIKRPREVPLTKTYAFLSFCAVDLIGAEVQSGAPLLGPVDHQWALRCCITYDDSGILELVLNRGVLTDMTIDLQANLVLTAIEYDVPVLLRFVLEKCTPFDTRSWSDSFLSVVPRGAFETMQVLLEYGMDIQHISDSYPRGLLYHAADWGSESIVRLLLKQGVGVGLNSDSNRKSQPGTTLSTKRKRQIGYRKDTISQEDPLRSTLHTRATVRTNIKLEVDSQNMEPVQKRFSDALLVAATNGHETIVQTLLQAGADPDPASITTKILFFHAAASGHHRIMALLLEYGVDVTARNGDLWYESLRVASWNVHIKAVKILLIIGTIVEVRTPAAYQKILQAAAVGGHHELVALFLDSTHFSSQERQIFSSALRQSSNLGLDSIAALLIEKGVHLLKSD